MSTKPSPVGTVICTFTGIRLTRYGPYRDPLTRYEVIEEDDVAGFSRPTFSNPLHAALCFFLDRGNRRYFIPKPFPATLRKEPG